MSNVVIVGAQWGDEGKAKIIDLLAEEADVVVRCQGGCNAGHTVKHQGEVYKFHHLPSGLLYPGKLCIVGSGTVILPEVFEKELAAIHARGISTEGLKVSSRAHVTLPFHIALDKASEERLAGNKIGTTGRGIGPTYMDKVGRLGLRIGDLYEPPHVLRERLTHLREVKAPLFEQVFQLPLESVDELMVLCARYADLFQPYVCDTVYLLSETVDQGKSMLFEGAQGTLLDVDFGTYPFVTSSNATAGGAVTGSGMGPNKIDRVIGVMKAYTTRVGSGPFPTELTDDVGRHLVEIGQEFGTTTGRQRRCGWFDAVIGRYSVIVNGLDGIALTKLDVMTGLPEVKLCVAYRHRDTGEQFDRYPAQLSQLCEMEPVYETMPGWQEPLSDVREYDALPLNARRYLERLAELIGAPLSIVSVGPEREQTMMLEHPMRSRSRATVGSV